MWIIDRYLLRQFVQVFVICFCSLDGLYVVFDAFSNLDEFLHFTEKQGNMLGTMFEFYAYRSIYFFDRVSSMLVMIAGMFTVTWIQRHNELTALMAAGVSRRRVITPIVAASVLISLATSAGRELLIPRMSRELEKDPKNLTGENGETIKPRFDNATNILMNGAQSFANEQRIHKPSFRLPDAMLRFGRQLVAENAYYEDARDGHEGGYLLKGVSRSAEIARQPSFVLAGKRVLITPRDEPRWLEPDQCFVVSDVNFDQFTGGRGWRQFSSTSQLIEGLSNPSLGLAGDFGADVRVSIHSRIVQPLLDLTLLFLGLPLVLSGNNRNVFMAILLCGLVSTAFMMVVMGSQYLGAVALLRPALAAWVPLMVFVPIAVSMFDRIER
ncbi:MAG TPA: LptF/LptG family permease [Pirellulales bacterium]|nr:LptF/LptG family permease [Pirellulales bacterium]